MTSLPDWMITRTEAADWDRLPDGLEMPNSRKGASPVRRATGAFAGLMANAIADDNTSSAPGLLQGIDARFKVVGLVGLIVVSTLVHGIAALALCYALFVGLAVASGASFRRMAGVWFFVPLFSALLMLPAALNIVTPGDPVLPLWQVGWPVHKMLSITDAGLFVWARFVLRTAVCVSLAGLLACTTPRPKLFQGLRSLGVPVIFVTLLNMMERYLVVLVRSAEEIHMAKISRSIAPRGLREEQAWVAAGMGSLFRRTYRLGNQVYLAMISRGYTGEIRLLDPPRARRRDWVFLISAGILAALVLSLG